MIVEISVVLPVAVRVDVRPGESGAEIVSVVSTECTPSVHDVRRALDEDAIAAIEDACTEDETP